MGTMMHCVDVWLPLWALTFGLLAYNTRRQYSLLTRLSKERPLDDLLHSAFTSEQWIESNAHTFHSLDKLLTGFLVVVATEYMAQGKCPLDIGQYLTEFGCLSAYKQFLCIATRLPPARQQSQVRYLCGVLPVSSHIDYGISGHTGMAVLLWFHIPSSSLGMVLALLQSALMIVTRDHYTLDVMHAWVFCLAVRGKFDTLCSQSASVWGGPRPKCPI